MHDVLIIAILAAAVRAGTPLLLATLGEILAEKAGVMNVGQEGMMLVGALSGFATYYGLYRAFGNESPSLYLLLGLCAGMLAAGVMALIHAFLTITTRANQVVSGLALTILGTGITNFMGDPYVGKAIPKGFPDMPIPFLAKIPLLGPALFTQNILVYLCYLLIPLLWIYIFRTYPGLVLRSVGESPRTADVMGINVAACRYLHVVAGGCLTGLAGAYLSLVYTPGWTESMTGGRGWIAIALVIFSGWNPVRAALGAYLFGGISGIQMRIQAAGTHIPADLLMMLPYVVTIIVLIIGTGSRRSGVAPKALGLPYVREERE